MIRQFLTFCIVFMFSIAQAQKTELRLFLNSGLFSFRGKSAAKTTLVNYNYYTKMAYANNAFGSKVGLCAGLSGDFKHIGRKKLILGMEAGYEILRSRVDIDGFFPYYNPLAIIPAKGKAFLAYGMFNFFPYGGYRFQVRRVSMDLSAGFDLAFSLNAKEKVKGSAQDGEKFDNSFEQKNIKTDIRPRIQLSASQEKFGAYLGYSYGSVNYASGYNGGNLECYPNLLRFGISYRFK